jgi:hypothetical protein
MVTIGMVMMVMVMVTMMVMVMRIVMVMVTLYGCYLSGITPRLHLCSPLLFLLWRPY